MSYKQIPEFPLYSIDSDGNVVSYVRPYKPRLLTNYITKRGAKIVSIGGTVKTVSSLVMSVFGPPPPTPKCEVWHKDLNKLNSNINNLEWNQRKDVNMNKFIDEAAVQSKREKMTEHWRSGRMDHIPETRKRNNLMRKLNALAEQGATELDD